MSFPLELATVLLFSLSIFEPPYETLSPPADNKRNSTIERHEISSSEPNGSIDENGKRSCCILKSGTPVKIEVIDNVSSETSVRGSKFRIRLSESIMDGTNVIVPSGATGFGEVVDSHPAGFSGKPAELVLAARYIEYGGVKIPIRKFRILVTGKNQTNSAMVVGVAFGVVGALVRGGEIIVPAGTKSDAIVAVDTNINIF